MKVMMSAVICCLALATSGYSFAWSDDTCSQGDCGSSACNPYVNQCQCTDPLCGSYDMNCLSTGACCEAFGNVGAR
jgi:hypothetical protein